MNNKNLDELIMKISSQEKKLRGFSKDTQQINPILRVNSIIGILENVDLPKNSTILDIGTGYGYGAVIFSKLGYNVIGIDINKDKLDVGMNYWRELGINFKEIKHPEEAIQSEKNIYFLKGDARDLSLFPDLSIDMASSFYIGWSMIGKKGVYEDLNRILKDNGKIILSTDGPSSLPVFFRDLVVKSITKFVYPQNMKLESHKKLASKYVYDKHVLVYKKNNIN